MFAEEMAILMLVTYILSKTDLVLRGFIQN